MLDIDAITCRMGKISNNLERHGEEDVPAFSIPITGLMLTREQLNDFLGDPYADRCWFNDKRDLAEPMPWCSKVTMTIGERYDGATATITFPSDEAIEFKGCRLNNITPDPKLGGLVQVDFQLQLTPGLGRENLLLQQYQNHEVKLSIADAKIALKKKDRQQDLPLSTQQGRNDPAASNDAPLNTHGNGEQPEAPKPRGRPRKNAEHALAH